MRNKIWIIVVVAVFILAVVATIWSFKHPTINPQTKAGLDVSVQNIHEADNLFQIDAEYPQFPSASNQFNQKISQLITGQISDFKNNSQDAWNARLSTWPSNTPTPAYPEQPFQFQETWQAAQLNTHYASFVIHIYSFSGGAHGDEQLYSFNYDFQAQKEISLTDLVGTNSATLQNLSKLSYQSVISDLQSRGWRVDENTTQMAQAGTAPDLKNFSTFNFNHNALIIYFQKYQVAPGAVGPLTETFYKSTLDQNSIPSSFLE